MAALGKLMKNGAGALSFAIVLTSLSFWIFWPLLPFIAEARGLALPTIGVLSGSTWLACLITLPCASRASARLSLKWVAAIAIVLVPIAGWLLLLPGELALWVGAILLGISTGLRWPVMDGWLALHVDRGSRGRWLTAVEALTGGAMLLGPAISAGAADMSTPISIGIAVGVAAVLITLFAAQPPNQSLDKLPDHSPVLPGYACGLPLALGVAAFLGGALEAGFSVAGSLIARSYGFSEAESLAVAAAVGAGSVVTLLLLGWAADRYAPLRLIFVSSVGITLAFILAATIPSALPLAALLIGGLGGGIYSLVILASLERSSERPVAVIASAAMAYTAGSLSAPAVTGWAIYTASAPAALAGFALASFGLALLVLTSLRGLNAVDDRRRRC
jgi:MFS family permease